ncbi:hypothetical protein FACS189461_1380 [Spirochaetia bacterium]|nr:hypothetical protein FACS189461_1380 [Spirochaetia bacterium]
MSKSVSTTVYLDDKDGNEVEFEVSASITPYRPARMYLRNGDPGYPEEGGELEDFEITPSPEDFGVTEDAVIEAANDGLYEDAEMQGL